MARIRTVKPEMWADEKLSTLEPIHRMVFVGIISMADDFGRMVDSVKQVDAFLFARTNHSAALSLEILHFINLIDRGQTPSGQDVIQIVNWEKHQKVNHPNTAAALPAITSSHARPARMPQERRKNGARTPKESFTPHISTNDLRSTTSTNDQRPEPSKGSGVIGEIFVDGKRHVLKPPTAEDFALRQAFIDRRNAERGAAGARPTESAE